MILQVGNWSRYLTDLFGWDAEDIARASEATGGDDDDRRGDEETSKYFHLLNALSDLLMLPKDMLMDRTIRKEVGLYTMNFIFPNISMACNRKLISAFICLIIFHVLLRRCAQHWVYQ